VKLSEV